MTYSIDLKNIFIKKVINGISFKNISEAIDISITTCYRWYDKYIDYINSKTFIKDKLTKIHKSNKINFYKDMIINYVNNNSEIILEDIKKDVTNNNLSISTISIFLKENKISRKRIKHKIVCKNLDKIHEERKTFAINQTENYNNYLCLDETSFCVSDKRLYGYSKKRSEINKLTKHKHNKERLSLISIISNKKIVCKKIYDGSLTAEKYLEFLKENRNKIKNKTIIQDNVRLHHAKIVKNYIDNNNINFKFIVAYTPQLNPIEMMFSQVKNNFRKLEHEDIRNDIEESLNIVKSKHLTNYYEHTINYINELRTL